MSRMTRRSDLTMVQLAELAGVSVSTVSRALAGSELIAKRTRESIEALARQHDFSPNLAARNLRTRRTGTIGVILPLGHQADQHLTDPFFMTMIGSLADELAERGFDMLLRRVLPTSEHWLSDLVASRRADGLILLGQSDQHEALNAVASRYANMVVWGAHLPDSRYLTVGSDNRKGGELAADYLLGKGRRNLTLLTNRDVPEFRLRAEGFLARCEGRTDVTISEEKVDLVSDRLLAQLPDMFARQSTDGVFACSDVIAMCAISVLKAQGRSVPAYVSVIGYDRVPLTGVGMILPATLDQQLSVGAKLLVASLVDRLAGRQVQSQMIDPQLFTSA